MKYVSFAEREGFKKGFEIGQRQEARKILGLVMNAKFGPPGGALVDHLGETNDLDRLVRHVVAAALATSLDDIRSLFEVADGNG